MSLPRVNTHTVPVGARSQTFLGGFMMGHGGGGVCVGKPNVKGPHACISTYLCPPLVLPTNNSRCTLWRAQPESSNAQFAAFGHNHLLLSVVNVYPPRMYVLFFLLFHNNINDQHLHYNTSYLLSIFIINMRICESYV